MSYQAVIATIHTRPHPNADRLLLGNVLGNQVVVGLDTKDGQLGVFFGPDGQLSDEFCQFNGLYNAAARAELLLAPVEKPGFFDVKRRVRSQNFRGTKSDGIWLPIESLAFTGADLSTLKVGDTLDTLNGKVFCEKYYTEATKRAMRQGKIGKPKPANPMFPKHVDTAQFRFLTEIPEDAVIYITEKLHGTSGRYGLVLEEQPRTFWQRLFRLPAKRVWSYLNGSRNVTLEHSAGEGFYGTNEFRYSAVSGLELDKGEVLFFELVGYVRENTPIMPAQDVTKLKDKTLEKTYGKRMLFKYGCDADETKLYVYKIVRFNEDGKGLELSWTQLVQRCKELGLEPVPLLGKAHVIQSEQYLKELVEKLSVGPSTLDGSHIREGVVVRIESPQGVQHVKNKSWEFGVLEGYIKEDKDYVDVEECS